MVDEKPVPSRKPRVDAQRNRVLLLETAKAAFADKGPGASLDEIARTAGVGAGTLYRHFPTRDALIEAVYRNETEQLVAAATQLAETHAPVGALREWLLLFVDYMAAKRGMQEALNSLVGGTSELYSASTEQMKRAIAQLLDRAAESGDIRSDLDGFDLLRALAGVANLGAGPDGMQAARRMVDILVAGMRTSAPSPE
ncbi:TetR/AcrR family transcriptional regulator [Bradyrhizobium sp. Ce-3]|uniref:TetR/AcrR family transcriptional regulator n=1 Tax=Bradyrhizobium sp. Ce-3 TaxID=2913970 RepID=UPI001FC7FC75|nr:TetR/AcrR family transcriptional regulator [Bradyrhizobium sp. Ce-3]GKQ53683.1 TetR family transcriptional regulator [Bradyrhizobium sp. Ce-3]